jgi:hypothetical protein
MYRLILGLVAALTAAGWGVSARATTLDFHDFVPNNTDGQCIANNQTGCYGDRANGPTSPLGSPYAGGGDTPNIGATYTGALRNWANGFGQSWYLGSDNADPSYLTLTADPGWAISLSTITLDIASFALGGNVDIFAGGIPGGAATPLLSLAISAAGEADPARVTTALALVGSQFTLKMPSQNFGIYQLGFNQVAATTPIPAALPLFASALAGLGFASWRRKRSGAA